MLLNGLGCLLFWWSECYFLSSSYLVVWDLSISHKLDIDTWDYFQCSVFKVPYNLLRKLLREIAARFSVFLPERFAFLFWIETVLSRFRGDREIRTLDPLLARQVLSQLSYAPLRVIMLLLVLALTFSVSFEFSPYGLKWTRTTDLTLIRRAL